MISMATDATDQKEMRNICIFLKKCIEFLLAKINFQIDLTRKTQNHVSRKKNDHDRTLSDKSCEIPERSRKNVCHKKEFL